MDEILDLFSRVEYLEKVTKFNQENLILTWTILGVVVGGIALSGFFLIKKWVDDRTDKELEKIKDEIVNEVTNYRVTSVLRTVSLSGIQTVSHSGKIYAMIIKASFEDERKTNNCQIISDTLMYTKNGASHDNIKLLCPNGATSEVRIKGLVENGFELEWFTDGEVEEVNLDLDIMIF